MVDKLTDGTGGYATVIGGGIGFNWTQLLLKSQPGRDIYFNITIFVSKTQSNVPRILPINQPWAGNLGFAAAAPPLPQPRPFVG